jgi:hypothetical protein
VDEESREELLEFAKKRLANNPDVTRMAHERYLRSCERSGIEPDEAEFAQFVWASLAEAYLGAQALVGEFFADEELEEAASLEGREPDEELHARMLGRITHHSPRSFALPREGEDFELDCGFPEIYTEGEEG